jgi:hypothetical protein
VTTTVFLTDLDLLFKRTPIMKCADYRCSREEINNWKVVFARRSRWRAFKTRFRLHPRSLRRRTRLHRPHLHRSRIRPNWSAGRRRKPGACRSPCCASNSKRKSD